MIFCKFDIYQKIKCTMFCNFMKYMDFMYNFADFNKSLKIKGYNSFFFFVRNFKNNFNKLAILDFFKY